jgi:MoaA/NifB/PqqE/SkfB family radical SAM enzyme
MIRIRIDGAGDEPFAGDPFVVRETDSAHIAAESDKNLGRHAGVVNERLRPLVAGLWGGAPPLFRLISVETRSGCNMGCGFCPVNKSADPREPGLLPLATIEKVAGELADLGYRHTILLFGNNEPLLDDRILDITRTFRRSCPESTIRILTNGTKLTNDFALALFDAGLTTLVVNNYTDGRTLIGPVRRLLGEAARFADADIRVSVRRVDEVLTNRAGAAPNKARLAEPMAQFCALPFVDLHVTYTGRVVLCCFDATGVTDFGNVNDSTLRELWEGREFRAVRAGLLGKNRGAHQLCAGCDFDGFRDPYQDTSKPLLRDQASDARWRTETL